MPVLVTADFFSKNKKTKLTKQGSQTSHCKHRAMDPVIALRGFFPRLDPDMLAGLVEADLGFTRDTLETV